MFTQIVITTTTDEQGNQFASIRRYDNHGKLGYTGNRCGTGRLYRTSQVGRIAKALRGMGFHHMFGGTYGKLIA